MPHEEPYRMAFCITDLEVGGAENNLVNLVLGLDPARFTPAVCVLAPPPAVQKCRLVERLRAAEIPVHFFRARGLRDAPRVLWQLTDYFRSLRPALVQSFLWHANTMATIAAQRAGVPRIVTGIRVAQPAARLRNFIDRRCDRWVDCHLCVSQAVANWARESAGLTPEKIEVIPNGVDADRFRGAEPVDLSKLGIDSARRMLLFVGRLDGQKGGESLLAALREILPHAPQHDCLIVGDGRQRNKLESLAAAHPLAGRVHFVGWQADVAAFYARSDLLLLASEYEGMPNVLLEAMASGKPVVARDVEGVAELLAACDPRQLADREMTGRFAENVLRILSDRLLAKEIGERNQTVAIESFSQTRMIASYQSLYRRLLERSDR